MIFFFVFRLGLCFFFRCRFHEWNCGDLDRDILDEKKEKSICHFNFFLINKTNKDIKMFFFFKFIMRLRSPLQLRTRHILNYLSGIYGNKMQLSESNWYYCEFITAKLGVWTKYAWKKIGILIYASFIGVFPNSPW